MSDKIRSCPSCNAAMEFRLGEFDCLSCGHSELAAQPTPIAKTSGPGFRKVESGDYGSASSPQGTLPTGTVYNPNEESYGPKIDAVDPLEKEKWVYFWIIILSNVLPLLLLALSGLIVGEPAILLVVFVVGLFVGVGLYITHWLIIGETVWIKWFAIALNSLWVLFLMLVIITDRADAPYNLSSTTHSIDSFEQGISDFFLKVYLAFLACWAGWFISILYRDIGRLGGFTFAAGQGDALGLEKRIYMGIHLLGGITIPIVIITSGVGLPEFYDMSASETFFSFLFVEAMQLAIIWFVLFGNFAVSKWCCGGCAGVTTLLGLATALGFFGFAEIPSGTASVITGIIQLVMLAWLVFLLWRDIKQHNAS